MYIAKLSLICLVAFAFMVGCGMLNKQAEMPETTTGSMEGEMMESDSMEGEMMESDSMEGEMMESDSAEAMTEATIEKVTLNVTGMM